MSNETKRSLCLKIAIVGVFMVLLGVVGLCYADKTVTVPDDAKIQIRIKEKTEVGEFNDAIYYTATEWSQVKEKDIETEKQRRINNWINAVKNPPEYIEPTKEELEKYKAELEAQEQELDSKIAEKEAKEAISEVEKVK